VLSQEGIVMRRRWVAWAGVVLGFLVVTLAGRTDEVTAAVAIKKLGGVVRMDNKKPGKPVTMVDLNGQGSRTKLVDADLKVLKEFKHLRHLSLYATQVTDGGMKELRELKSSQTLKQ